MDASGPMVDGDNLVSFGYVEQEYRGGFLVNIDVKVFTPAYKYSGNANNSFPHSPTRLAISLFTQSNTKARHFLSFSLSLSTRVSTMTPVVLIPNHGLVQGIYDEEKHVRRFLNIPFATVHKRWHRASPVAPWTGIRDATQYGYAPNSDAVTKRFGHQSLISRRSYSSP